MGTLTQCIKKAGKALDSKDANAIQAMRNELKNEGMTAEVAGLEAVALHMQDTLSTRDAILGDAGVSAEAFPVQVTLSQYQGPGRKFKMDLEKEAPTPTRKSRLSAQDTAKIDEFVKPLSLTNAEVASLKESVRVTRSRFRPESGWAAIELAGVARSKPDGKGNTKVSLKWKQQGYNYHLPPGVKRDPGKVDEKWLNKVASEFEAMVRAVYRRAERGDANAKTIVGHAAWYRNVAEVLRNEFGAQGDLLSDLLGATSPNTPVPTNWKFSIDILRRFVRGEFDSSMQAMHEHLESGGTMNDLPSQHYIRQENGKLYGINSRNAMQAMYNSWRTIRKGTAPKARNFALNLIGQSSMATIDVWAARMLRRAAAKAGSASAFKRIPVPAEKSVSGGFTEDLSSVTGEYGFGAAVMDKVSGSLAKDGIVIAPPDLQAIAWFAEKELWGKNRWTSDLGESGSFEEQIEAMPFERYTAGWSLQQGGTVPSKADVSAAQARVLGQLQGDSTVISARVLPTIGRYAGNQETSFDTEWTVKKGEHDPSLVMAEIAQLAKENNQKDVVVSRVLGMDEESDNARPGLEIYLKNEKSLDEVIKILDALTASGVDGFTLAVDPRVKSEKNYIGIRMQYVPEIAMRYSPALREIMSTEAGAAAEIEAATARILDAVGSVMDMDGVAYAKMYQYDTVVLGEEGDYDAYIEAAGREKSEVQGGQSRLGGSLSEELERAAARLEGDTLSVDPGRVQDAGDGASAELTREVDPYESMPVRPGTTEQQKSAGRSAIRNFQRRLNAILRRERESSGVSGGGEVSVLGKQLLADFQAGRSGQLIGSIAKTPADVAALAQVYRDPRFETLRFIIMKGDRVVGETAITSRDPGAVGFSPNQLAAIDDRMDYLEADGYYILHNHPSGDPSPSQADLVATRNISRDHPGMLGHVVIDFNSYSSIAPDGKYKKFESDFNAVDFRSQREVPHDVVGFKVSTAEDVSILGKRLGQDDRFVLVHTGPDGVVNAITSLPVDFFDILNTNPSLQKSALASFRGMMRETGSVGLTWLVAPENSDYVSSPFGIASGYFSAMINADGVVFGNSQGGYAYQKVFPNRVGQDSVSERLDGMPETVMVDGKEVPFENFDVAVKAAKDYMKSTGREYAEQTQYAELDRARAIRIAKEFELMEHRPQDPKVKAAYEALINETLAQYDAVLATGLKVRFIKGGDPYGNPRNAVLDVIHNNNLFVFPTNDGFGSNEDFDPLQNPLLAPTKYKTEDGEPMLANDVFRVVHDYFGHIKNGVGFRARGEENAWQSHASMYSPLARRAMTVETRGQNSWVNFGPNAAENATANGADTIYADQKIGLLPQWVSEDGRLSGTRSASQYSAGLSGAVDGDAVTLVHYSQQPIQRTEPAKAGTGTDARAKRYKPQVTYFGIEADERGYIKESQLGRIRTEFTLPVTQLYPADRNPENLWVRGNYAQSIENMQEAGFSGYWADNSSLGKVAVIWDPLQASESSLLLARESSDANMATRNLSVAQAQKAIDQLPDNVKSNVTVVATVADLRKLVPDVSYSRGTKGLYIPETGQIYVVAGNHANAKEIAVTMLHEAIGHRGLFETLGPKTREFLNMVQSARGTDPVIDEAYEYVERAYAGSSDLVKAAEVVAYISESDPKYGLVQRAVQWMRQLLRDLGFRVIFSNRDITQALARAKQGALGGVAMPTSSAPVGPVERRSDRQKAAPTFGLTEETAIDFVVRKFQNKFLPLKRLQSAIKESGGVITEESDAYLAEELFHGKGTNDLRMMEEERVQPMVAAMGERKVTQEMLDDYLMAMHAPERNAHIARINPKFPDGGSGMTNKEAATIIARFRKEGKLADLDHVSQYVYDMLELQRKALRDGGLEDDGTIMVWERKYKHYVPLKGVAEDHKSHPQTGQGFEVRAKSWKPALGRSSRALSPSSYAVIDLSEKLIERRKNEVGNAFLKLVQSNPNKDYWEVFDEDNPDVVRALDSKGMVVERAASMFMSSEYFMTKVKGKRYYVKIKDAHLLKAMKNLGPEQMNMLTRGLASVNRWLSSVNTSYSPEFMISNFARDFQTAKLNLQAERSLGAQGKTDGKKVEANLRRTLKSIRFISMSLAGKKAKSKEGQFIQDYFEEYRATGAQTGYFDMKDLDGQMKDVQRLLKMGDGTVGGSALKYAKAAKDAVENVNTAVENGVRLAAYISAREEGMSPKASASLAKNMTVNFNRRGEVGGLLNAAYMFANASIQGTANFVRTMGTLRKGERGLARLNNAQKIAVAMYGASYALSVIMRLGSDDDDDGRSFYDKVPQYVKERNIVIMKKMFGASDDPADYWKIPLPYGYNIFHVMGVATERIIQGDPDYTSMRAATEVTLALLGSFSPVGFSDSEQGIAGVMAKNMPTITKPVIEILMNENFANSPVYRANFPFATERPASTLSKYGTPAGYKALAKFLNEVTGGNDFVPGGIDVSPDIMAYMVDYALGSAGTFVFGKVPDTAYRVATGQALDVTRAPFLSKVNGRVSEYSDHDMYYERVNKVKQVIDGAKNTLDADQRKKFLDKYGGEYSLQGALKMSEKRLRLVRKQQKLVYGSDMPRAEMDAKLEEYKLQQEKIIDEFNGAYNKVMDK